MTGTFNAMFSKSTEPGSSVRELLVIEQRKALRLGLKRRACSFVQNQVWDSTLPVYARVTEVLDNAYWQLTEDFD